MPIYEYRCPNGHVFELFQRFDDPSLESCESCGAPVAKVLYPVAVHFKGSGFYSTDYGRGGKKKDAAKESSSSDGAPPPDAPKKSDEKPKKAAEA